MDNKFDTLSDLIEKLKEKFKVSVFENVDLYTIRHADDKSVEKIQKNKDVLLKQVLQHTVQMVILQKS